MQWKYLLCVLSAFCYLQSHKCEQNYIVNNESVESLEGEKETLFDFGALQCIGRERAINGSVTVLEDLDNDQFKMSVELWISPSNNGDYRKMGMDVPPTGLCEAFKKFHVQFVQPSFVPDDNTNFPHVPDEGLCPFPKGSYYIKTLMLNTDLWPQQVARGTIKCIVKFTKNDKRVGGLTAIVKIQDRG